MTEPNRFGPPEPSREPPPFFTTPVPGPGMGSPPNPPANPYAPAAAPPYGPGVPSFGTPAYSQPGYPPPGYPPAYPPVGVAGYAGPAHVVRGNKGLGIAMLILGGVLVLFCVLRALTAPSAVHKLDLYAAHGIDTRRVATAHDAVGLLGVVVIPLFIVGALWLYRAQSNARAIAPHQVRRARAWSWFGWITPIATWFVPKQIVDDSWRVTAPPEAGPQSPARRRSTALWWGLWVTFGIFSGAGTRVWVSYGSGIPNGSCLCGIYTGHRGISPGLDLVVALLAVAAYAAFVPIALGLSNAQEELVTRLRGSGPITY
jgi:hypothetical protein